MAFNLGGIMHNDTVNGKKVIVVDMPDWTGSFSEDFKSGDYVSDEIAWSLINVLPPHRIERYYFQVGEPAGHRTTPTGDFLPVYVTLVKQTESVWEYCGLCFTDESVEA